MSSNRKNSAVNKSKSGNSLIDSLPSRQRNSVLAQCKLVELDFGTILCEPGIPMEYAYFPIAGNISTVKVMMGQEPFEIESTGNEGMFGVSLILDINRAPERGIARAPCLALRIDPGGLRSAFNDHPALARILQRYLYFVILELSQTAACIRFHDVKKRLAHTLLLAHDRAETDHLFLTHQMLGEMLGVRRGAISIPAGRWQQEGLIRYSRGRLHIVDRKGLEQKSCGCYQASIENYKNIF